MRWVPTVVCAVCVLGQLVAANPVPQTLLQQQAQLPTQVQETLRSLQDEGALEEVTRDKRTIAVLRSLFPHLSQIVDRQIQRITQYLFRVIGRLVLRGGLGGGGGGGATAGGGAGTGGNRRISITLPTYPPDLEVEEDEDEANTEAESTTESNTDATPTEEINPEENQLSGAESQQNEVRVQYTGEQQPAYDDTDQEPAASGGNSVPDPAIAEIASEDAGDGEDARNKRLTSFSLGGSGGSGGGSGNFLFDIIRLVAGSGNTEASSDQSAHLGAEATVEKDDGYQAGIPGPITRLFVIANRGIANLMQDLILRLAQTSERIVNFKARLITSII